MTTFQVPTRETVTPDNQAIFDKLKAGLGFVPNIYATYALSSNALGRVLTFANGKTTLSNKEKEVVNLAVSQVNECNYCLAAHTAIGKMNGFTDDQILEIRTGRATFDVKFDALAQVAREIAQHHGNVREATLENFFAAGYSQENLVDTIVAVGEKAITNYLWHITQIPIDFPAAPELEEATI